MRFFPFGLFFYDLLKSKREIIIYVICAFAFSLGMAEVDDVIHNTLGAFIGYLACVYVPKIQITIKK